MLIHGRRCFVYMLPGLLCAIFLALPGAICAVDAEVMGTPLVPVAPAAPLPTNDDAKAAGVEEKDPEAKQVLESKKKLDFKTKSEKYQKLASKDPGDVKVQDETESTTTSTSTLTSLPTSGKLVKFEKDKRIIGHVGNLTEDNLPFVLHGKPIEASVIKIGYDKPSSTVSPKSSTRATPVSDTTTHSSDPANGDVPATEETTLSRGRALNVSAPEPTNSLHANLTDLSDVSMDDDDDNGEGGEYVAPYNETSTMNISSTLIPTSAVAASVCIYANQTYKLGEKIVKECEEKCVCGEGGKLLDCQPVCSGALFRTGRNKDPYCFENKIPEQPCCVALVCADSAPEPDETCVFGNKTYARGERIEDGCSKICVCEAGGSLKCQPRCPPNETAPINHHDRCVVLTDPRDPCCAVTYCDVSLGDHEIKSESPTDLAVNMSDVKVLNSTAIKLRLSTKNPEDVVIEISGDNHLWRQQKPDKEGIISNLEPAHTYFVRISENGRTSPALQVSLPAEVVKTNITEKLDGKNSCSHRGKLYKIGAEWYDECISFCVCSEGGKTDCSTIECPTDFGLDVLDPHCLDWETVPANFVPKAPQCCPQEVRCRNNGSCHYEGRTYDNWSEIPTNVTGCEKRCYCEMGNVSCQAACPPVPALPPANLQCPTYQAALMHLPGDECCLQWICGSGVKDLPGNETTAFPGPLSFDEKTRNTTEQILPVERDPERATSWDRTKDTTTPVSDPHHLFHYPMDPGHPTVPYNGPYNPDFKPTEPNIAQVFHLAPAPDKNVVAKDKNKSKSDAKKPLDVVKHFPGPLAPEKFDSTPTKVNNRVQDQPQFVPLAPALQEFSPSNGESIPPSRFDPHFEVQAGPPYAGDPNLVVSANPKKKLVEDKVKGGVKPGGRQELLPDELYHLINLQHPGLFQLNHAPPTGHQGLYELHSELANPASKNPGSQNYFGGQKGVKPPQVFTQKNENGETTYHIHTPEIPSSPQQIEQLLAHISQHDPNPGPFQHYPGEPALSHNIQTLPATGMPFHPLESQSPHPGVTHLNHPFVAQTPNQSGLDHNVPMGFPTHGFPTQNTQSSSDEVTVQILEALDEHTVRLVFTVPHVLVGLHGRVELRYTGDKANMDPSTWKTQVFAPPNDLIATPQLEFELGDLKPSTDYKVKITVKLQDIANTPTSKIYSVRTLEKLMEVSTLPPQIPINPELTVMEKNSSWINVMWKKFSDYELQFIDGVQLRYKEQDGKVYAATPLIHRAVTNYFIENLRPDTTYEVGIYFIPFPGQTTELISEKTIQVRTSTEPDPYSFDVKVEIKAIKSSEVEVSWSGVPYPEDKYVNIYRAIYQSDSGKEDTSTFKIAKRDSPAKTIISDLKPGTRYRLWIEVYLTNGRTKKSNVQDFVTKPGVLLPSGVSQQGKLASSIPLHEGDYYGPLVIVAIVASLAILSTLILLMMLMKRRTSSKADISPRKSTSAYDNPSYKTCEDAVTVTNGVEKATEHEMTAINTNNDAKETA